jgi:hypothetical protein
VEINEAINASEMHERSLSNGDGHIDTSMRHENAFQSGYEAGLALGKEAGYRLGYQEGFSDCCKLGNPARAVATTPGTSTSALREPADNRVSRLKGLPCANCGCPSYSDEAQCSRCGTPKATSGRAHSAVVG